MFVVNLLRLDCVCLWFGSCYGVLALGDKLRLSVLSFNEALQCGQKGYHHPFSDNAFVPHCWRFLCTQLMVGRPWLIIDGAPCLETPLNTFCLKKARPSWNFLLAFWRGILYICITLCHATLERNLPDHPKCCQPSAYAPSIFKIFKAALSITLFGQTSIFVLVHPVEDILGSLLDRCPKSQYIMDLCRLRWVDYSIAVHAVRYESSFELLFQVTMMTSRNSLNFMNPFLSMLKMPKTSSRNCSALPIGKTILNSPTKLDAPPMKIYRKFINLVEQNFPIQHQKTISMVCF